MAELEWDRRFPGNRTDNTYSLTDAPASVAAIRDLGAGQRTLEQNNRRRRFGVLWREAQARIELRGWKSNPGSKCELYVPSNREPRLWCSPTGDQMRVKVTTATSAEVTALLPSLNAAKLAGLAGAPFKRDGLTTMATVSLATFFAGCTDAEAMAGRLADLVDGALRVIEGAEGESPRGKDGVASSSGAEASSEMPPEAQSTAGTEALSSASQASADVDQRLEQLESLRQRLAALGSLDLPVDTWRRAEQKILRALRLTGIDAAPCSLCGRELPEGLLVLAHIKPRAQCTDEERRDHANNTLLACRLGCDELFERGYIAVRAGRVVEGRRAAETSDARLMVDTLVGRTCSDWTEMSSPYFDWQATAQRAHIRDV